MPTRHTLIADAGSTKTDWILLSEGKLTTLQTAGINPVTMSLEAIIDTLNSVSAQLACHVDQLYFYGAGCAPGRFADKMHNLLKSTLEVDVVEVETDLLGAARALCGHTAGVACILGTGSNTCCYDGQNITANVPPLGYILGDEGSGTSIGKAVLNICFKGGDATRTIRERLLNWCGLTYADIIEKTYRQPGANTFLASLAPFAAQNIDNEHINAAVAEVFSAFVNKNLRHYDLPSGAVVHFVGSIASHFQRPLQRALHEAGYEMGVVERAPLQRLANFHLGR